LFGLFLHSDDAELADLATIVQAPKLSETVESEKRKRLHLSEPVEAEKRKRPHSSLSWDEKSIEPSTLSLVSESLQNASGYMGSLERPRRGGNNAIRNTERSNRILQSNDIHEIELIVKDKFLNSPQGKQALAKRSPEEGYVPKYEPFSLEYNEVSMSGIASWALQNEEESPSAQQVPAPLVLFQQCGICCKWGHYEIECMQVLPSADDEMIELSQQVQIQKKQQEAQLKPKPHDDSIVCGFCKTALSGEPNLKCHGCSSSFHTSCISATPRDVSTPGWFCESCEDNLSDVSSVIELEGCEGFVIEQRKRQRLDDNNDSNLDDEWNAAIGIRCHPKTKINAVRTTEPSLPERPNEDQLPEGLVGIDAELIVPGDLCWTRRGCSDSKPPSENDDWWPSVVKFIQPSTFGWGQSFIAKRLGTMATSVKTSIVLPFFQNFDRLGYRRVLGNHPLRAAWDAPRFESALKMAVQESGNVYLQHFLQETKESNRQAQRPVENSATHYSYTETQPHPQNWEEADEAIQDGFLIRAKEMSSRNLISSPEMAERQLVGSTVAWSSSSPGALARKGDDTMHIGTVLAVNLGDETALVEIIQHWKDVLPEASEKDSFIVNSCSMGSSVWIQMENLRVISSGAPLHLQFEFSNEIAPTLLREANDQREQVYRTGDTRYSIPSTRPHVRTKRSMEGCHAALGPEGDKATDTCALNVLDSELQDESSFCGEQSTSETNKRAKKSIYPYFQRYNSWQMADTNGIPPIHWMKILLRQCFDDELQRSQHECAVRTRFKRAFSPADITFDRKTKEWKVSEHLRLCDKPVDRESCDGDDEKVAAAVADGGSENSDAESSHVDPVDVSSKERVAPIKKLKLMREKAWKRIGSEAEPPLHWMHILLKQRFDDENERSQKENALRTRFRRAFNPKDVVYNDKTEEWKLLAESATHNKDGENVNTDASLVEPMDVPNEDGMAPTKEVHFLREQAWKGIDRKAEPPLRWMHILLKQRFDDENERSQKEKALRTRFRRAFYPADVVYNDETEEWKLLAESAKHDKAGDTESSKDGDGKPAKADDSFFTTPQFTRDDSEDVAMRSSPMDSVDDSHDEEALPRKIQRQLREQAWRRVGKEAMPPVHWMCVLLKQCCNDEHERSQKGKAVTYRFKRSFSPGDVVYNEKTEEWKLARGFISHTQPFERETANATASATTADAFAGEQRESTGMKDAEVAASFDLNDANDAKPSAVATGIKPSALLPSPKPDHKAVDLNLSAVDSIEIDRVAEESPNQDERSETPPRKKGKDKVFREMAWKRVDASDIPPPQVMSTLLSQCFDGESEKAQNDKAIRARFKRHIPHDDVIYNEEKKIWMISPDSSLLHKTDGNKPSSKVNEGFRPLRLLKEKDAKRTVTDAVAETPATAPVDSSQDQEIDLHTNPAEGAKLRRNRETPKAQSNDQKGSKSHAQEPEGPKTDTDSNWSEEPDDEASAANEEEQPLPQVLEELAAEGLYAVEDILDDRLVVVKGKSFRSEYLIKWKGYGMDECTWEPKSSVVDPCLVERYDVKKIYEKLSRLKPKEQDQRTKLVVRALKNGLPKLEALLNQGLVCGEKRPKVTRRVCPFCRKAFGSNLSPFKNHLRTHESESKNADLLLEAAMVIREEWLD
jgi:hypothetical protein